ncbi:MAG: hypothetical protein H5T50_08880 [Nitrososphaeria archaeon]|nr:hypothetical protein [Nitrososphaeria archaeon]
MTKKEKIKKIGKKKGIENRLKELFNSNYDIIFFILGTNYLFTILDALKEIPEETRGIFFGSKRNMELIPETYFKIISSDREKNKLRTTLMELKGRQLLNVAVNVKKNPYLLYKIRNDRDLLYRLSLNAR